MGVTGLRGLGSSFWFEGVRALGVGFRVSFCRFVHARVGVPVRWGGVGVSFTPAGP